MTKKQVFRIYLTTSTIEVYLCSILSTYLLTYIIQQISVGNRSTMILVGSTVAMLTSYILRKRSNIINLRKYFTILQLLTIVFQIIIGISLLYDPLVAGIVNTIMGNSIYNITYGIEQDIWNHLFNKSSRTIVDNVFNMYSKFAMMAGSLTIITIDSVYKVASEMIAYGSIIIILIIVTMDHFNIKLLERMKRKNKRS